jgi:PHP family Zn ribbon phosphoesterase
VSQPDRKTEKQLVCRNCNTEFSVPKAKLTGSLCPECGTKTPPPKNPIQQHIKIVN